MVFDLLRNLAVGVLHYLRWHSLSFEDSDCWYPSLPSLGFFYLLSILVVRVLRGFLRRVGSLLD